jgi:hypothetical protein
MTPPNAREALTTASRTRPADGVEDRLRRIEAKLDQLLAARQPDVEVIDAATLARRLGRSRDWVYDNADQLGALRTGLGGRMSFAWPTVLDALSGRHPSERSPSPKPSDSRRLRPRRRSSSGTNGDVVPELLPVRPPKPGRGRSRS